MILNILLLLFSAIPIKQNIGLDLFHHLPDESTSTPQLKLQHSSALIIICSLCAVVYIGDQSLLNKNAKFA